MQVNSGALIPELDSRSSSLYLISSSSDETVPLNLGIYYYVTPEMNITVTLTTLSGR